MPICVALQGYLYAMQACADKKLLHQPGSKFSSTNLCNADFVTMKAGSHIFLSFLRGEAGFLLLHTHVALFSDSVLCTPYVQAGLIHLTDK